ncbi:MAG: universal stress protein [Mycobacteriaceae bacterium]|nr:universal stress protein [Mycobacteriaceae bacterium]
MSASQSYHTIVVGASGSAASAHAVQKAANLAAATTARLVLVCAYDTRRPDRDIEAYADALGADGYLVRGTTPIDNLLRDAAESAARHGAVDVERRAVRGHPAVVLPKVAADTGAHLIVVGHAAADGLRGRWWSLGAELERATGLDILVVSPDETRPGPARFGCTRASKLRAAASTLRLRARDTLAHA